MSHTTISHFDCADNGHPVHAVIQPDGHFVQLSLNPRIGSDVAARLAPKQARRLADALRVAAREAEDNGKPNHAPEVDLDAQEGPR